MSNLHLHLEAIRHALRFEHIGRRKLDELMDLYEHMQADGLDDKAIALRQAAAKAILSHYHLLLRLLPAAAIADAVPVQIDAATLAAMLKEVRAVPANDNSTGDTGEAPDAAG